MDKYVVRKIITRGGILKYKSDNKCFKAGSILKVQHGVITISVLRAQAVTRPKSFLCMSYVWSIFLMKA